MAVTQDRLDAAISQVLAEMERRFAEQTRWIVGTGIAVAAVIIAAMKL